jgi:hypothetical protein
MYKIGALLLHDAILFLLREVNGFSSYSIKDFNFCLLNEERKNASKR